MTNEKNIFAVIIFSTSLSDHDPTICIRKINYIKYEVGPVKRRKKIDIDVMTKDIIIIDLQLFHQTTAVILALKWVSMTNMSTPKMSEGDKIL